LFSTVSSALVAGLAAAHAAARADIPPAAPYDIDPKVGSWADDRFKHAYADRIFSIVDEWCPGFSDSVIGRDVLSPLDLERVFGLHKVIMLLVLLVLRVMLLVLLLLLLLLVLLLSFSRSQGQHLPRQPEPAPGEETLICCGALWTPRCHLPAMIRSSNAACACTSWATRGPWRAFRVTAAPCRTCTCARAGRTRAAASWVQLGATPRR